MLKIQSFVFNPFEENTYILYDETRSCIIVDPGCYEDEEKEELAEYIEENNLHVVMLVNTHCHIDHVLGNSFVMEKYNVPLYVHKLEEPYLRAVQTYAPNYGFYAYSHSTPDAFMSDNENIEFGRQQLQVIFAPGHSPGHVVLYHKDSKSLIGGDVLFHSSIGRTDLPGGNMKVLLESIHQRLFTLPDDVTVYPGHGEETTIGFEKRTNPFCALPAK